MNNQMQNMMQGNQMSNVMSNNRMSDSSSLSDKPLGMAYVPWQQNFEPVYDLDKAFCRGTLFPCLDKPFLGRGGCK